MLYAILAEDHPDSLQKRLSVRSKHLARLKILQNQGRLFVAGPHPSIDCEDPGEAGFSGSLIIAHFDSLQDAQSWADVDPYIKAGVYYKVVVKPFKHVLP